ncbi:hypothetical protein D9758_009728 [Tetrapyrgos nigripes]|uniref:Uncharacterized protein n=1 Tax=Tetrapyrgos nigripes TaxID=182062 RepID=A0A8H5GKK0_9AGAR|nr:hypothetical protein D9758_009728 [Tetrapyrgos nigripes]
MSIAVESSASRPFTSIIGTSASHVTASIPCHSEPTGVTSVVVSPIGYPVSSGVVSSIAVATTSVVSSAPVASTSVVIGTSAPQGTTNVTCSEPTGVTSVIISSIGYPVSSGVVSSTPVTVTSVVVGTPSSRPITSVIGTSASQDTTSEVHCQCHSEPAITIGYPVSSGVFSSVAVQQPLSSSDPLLAVHLLVLLEPLPPRLLPVFPCQPESTGVTSIVVPSIGYPVSSGVVSSVTVPTSVVSSRPIATTSIVSSRPVATTSIVSSAPVATTSIVSSAPVATTSIVSSAPVATTSVVSSVPVSMSYVL